MADLDDIDLVPLLKGVPEFQPKIIPLAWSLVNEDGEVNPKKAAYYSDELDEASQEAENYSRETKELIQCLRKIVQSRY